MVGLLAPAKARRAEEDHRVLNLLAAEARQRLHVLGDDADQPPVGAVQKAGVLIGQRRDCASGGGAPLPGIDRLPVADL